jgi:4-amino-4-deoxy-L-arabinose transferase-like glycosyltransferase
MDFFLNLSLKEKILLAILVVGTLLCVVTSFFWGGIVFGALFSFFYTSKVLELVENVKTNFLTLSWLEQLVLSVAAVYFLCLTFGFFVGLLLGLGVKRVLS